ncbi:MAG: DUF6850 family outer membrane beta-barrel protein [Bacteroidales bacterium]
MKNYIINKASLICGLLIPIVVQAQEASKPFVNQTAIEFTKAKSLWFNTNNAAGFSIIPLIDHSEVSASYLFQKGDYKRQQQGDSEKDVKFNANGALALKDAFLWGSFTFSNIAVDGSRFNTILFDPFRDMPYYVADSVQSEWKKQLYDLRLKASTPLLWNRIAFGCELDYITKTGAKQNDPRSTSYYYSISARPSLLYKINDKNYIGVNGLYENMFERTVPTISNTQQNQPVFIMRGLGNYSSGSVGGQGGIGIFYYKSNKIGGGVQYGYQGSINVLLDVKGHYKVEDAFQSPTKPQRMGSTEQLLVNGNLQVLLAGDYTHKFTFDYMDKSTDGIEYIQVIDNSYEVQKWVTIEKYVRSNYSFKGASFAYDLFRGSDKGYSWRAGLVSQYSNMNDEYYLPKSKFNAENINASVFAKKNLVIGKQGLLLFGLNLGYSSNISGEFIYTGADPNSVIIEEFYKKDLAYLTSDYYSAGLNFNYSLALEKSNTALFVAGDCQVIKPTEGSDNRVNAVFSVGFTF